MICLTHLLENNTMQRTLKLYLTLLLLFPITIFATLRPVGTLKIMITGFKNDTGVARVALFNSRAAYDAAGGSGQGAYFKAAVPIHNGKVNLTVSNLPYGEYAIKFFQDVNNSGQLKTNIFGKPMAGYGFSNNPNASKGPASYDQAKFTFNQKQVALQLTVNK